MLELRFPNDSATVLDTHTRPRAAVQGRDATELLEGWRQRGWTAYEGEAFRQRLIEWSGAEAVTGADEDDVILAAVVKAFEGTGVVLLAEVQEGLGVSRRG